MKMFSVDTFRLHQEKMHGVTPANFGLKFASLAANHIAEEVALREKWATVEDPADAFAFNKYGYAVDKKVKKVRKNAAKPKAVKEDKSNRGRKPLPKVSLECKVNHTYNIIPFNYMIVGTYLSPQTRYFEKRTLDTR